MTHDEAKSLLGAYALDAVDPDEAAAVEEHLAACARCRAEVSEHRETAAMLASSGSDAPHGLWDRIAGGLEEPPPPLQLAPIRLAAARRRRWMKTAALATAAAAVIAAVVGLGARVQQLDHQLASLRGPLQQQGIDQAALAALTDPSSHQVTLRAAAGPANVQAVVLRDGRGFIVHTDLPPLPVTMTYQLWGVVDGHTKVSLGLLGARPAVTAFRLDPAAVSLLAITAEQAGGVATTDKPAVAWAPYTA